MNKVQAPLETLDVEACAMKDILELAEKYQLDVKRRAIAHELSSEWHRSRGALLGGAATVLSAIVGTSVFAALANGKLDLSSLGWWYLPVSAAVGFVAIVSAVVTGVQSYLRHPEQAATHKASYVGYCRLEQRLDIFCRRYSEGACGPEAREQALKELDKISKDLEIVAGNSITLARRAYSDADEKISGIKRKPWWKRWWKHDNAVA